MMFITRFSQKSALSPYINFLLKVLADSNNPFYLSFAGKTFIVPLTLVYIVLAQEKAASCEAAFCFALCRC